MGILPWLYCSQDFPIKHTGILYPVSKSLWMQYHSSTFCTFLNYFTAWNKSRTEGERWKPATSALQRRLLCWHVWIRSVSVYKIIFYKDKKTTPAAFTFCNAARIFQNLARWECDPKFHVLHWFYNWLYSWGQYLETCKTYFFQLICLPKQLLPTDILRLSNRWWQRSEQWLNYCDNSLPPCGLQPKTSLYFIFSIQ